MAWTAVVGRYGAAQVHGTLRRRAVLVHPPVDIRLTHLIADMLRIVRFFRNNTFKELYVFHDGTIMVYEINSWPLVRGGDNLLVICFPSVAKYTYYLFAA